MNKRAAQIREDEKVQRKLLELAFEEVVWRLIRDIEDKDVSLWLERRNVWRCLYIPPSGVIGLWPSQQKIIDLPLLSRKPNLRLTMDGLRVILPNERNPYCVRDTSLDQYNNDELREMTQSICAVYEDQR